MSEPTTALWRYWNRLSLTMRVLSVNYSREWGTASLLCFKAKPVRYLCVPAILRWYWWDRMYGWGKRRGSGSRASQSNFDVGDGRTDPRDRRSHATPEVTEVIYVEKRRPLIELVIIVAFAVSIAVTIEIVLLALAFQVGTGRPYDLNVDHVQEYCYASSDVGDMASRAQQMLPLDRSSGRSSSSSDQEYKGTGSSITIYVPCSSGGSDDEGYDRGSGYSGGDDSSGGYYLRRRPGDGRSQ